MPGGHVEGKVQDDLVMGFREQPLEDRYPALERDSAFFPTPTQKQKCTWMMSSKPLAVIFVSDETLPPNFLIVSRPNVGTRRKLCTFR